MKRNNILKDILIDKSKEEFTDILNSENVRIERIVSNGQTSPDEFWYCQEENEFVLVLEGNAILEFDDKDIELKKGDYIDIKAGLRHRVKYTSNKETTIWLAVFY